MADWLYHRGLQILILGISAPLLTYCLIHAVREIWEDFHDEELWKDEKWG